MSLFEYIETIIKNIEELSNEDSKHSKTIEWRQGRINCLARTALNEIIKMKNIN